MKIAVAGASGQLAREIIDGLVETGKHEIVGLMRKDPSAFPSLPGVTWVHTKFDDKAELVRLLAGVQVLLCFFTPLGKAAVDAQKLLIDAAVEAGVPRYAAGEWAMGHKLEECLPVVPWYGDKLIIRKYLADLNKDRKALEYTMVWPGMFANYLCAPHKTTEHVSAFEMILNIDKGVALAAEGYADGRVSLTTMADIKKFVARIVEYEGEWPVQGGFCAETMTYGDLLKMAERVRGAPMEVEWLKMEDLRQSKLLSKWVPKIDHPGVPADRVDEMSHTTFAGFVAAMSLGGWETTNEWNKLIPDFKFTGIEEFLTPLFQSKK